MEYRTNRFLSIIAIPVLFWIYAWIDYSPSMIHSDGHSTPVGYQVPNHIHSAEYRMILEKTFIEMFDEPISSQMEEQNFKWLGYCTECIDDLEIDSVNESSKCGDRLEWGGKVFCMEW